MRFAIALLVLLMFCVQAQAALYADVLIEVDRAGEVSMTGRTNHLDLSGKTQAYTSKKGEFWLLNITTEEVFGRYIYELTLPGDASINYLRTPRLSRIEETDGKIRIFGAGDNKPFMVVVQYSFTGHKKGYLVPALAVIGLVLSVAGAYMLIRKRKNDKAPRISQEMLSERQKLICRILQKESHMTQSRLEQLSGIPKASLSRNIETLSRMGIIEKSQNGMTNLLTIKR